ncbi:MAG: uracil-DNA glycosylase [Chloroflexi bacterium]|jgi:uracil-DNA glycosylase|nr:uracil-DNA glycosylase [Chloroflexota bacterium]MBT7081357.1 uracil-DNA glycosylase [Chloroflexota bacterium]MBT7290665.1 uracil-DNA glycosylase [Chloroflexota bacterium]
MVGLTQLCQQMALCQDCALAKTRNMVVPGEGLVSAEIMLIGEAPGFNEDKQGRPFVGQAGKFLGELLSSIGLTRQDVYIANVIKCRPPNNRDPLPPEISACEKWLDSQVELIAPKMIVTLGRYSMARYFDGQSIGKIHGTVKEDNDILYFAMYHPAAALHQPRLKQVILDDMRKIPGILAKHVVAKPDETERPEQLSMFKK